MTEEVRLIRGNDRIAQLAERHGIVDEVAQIRAEMDETDRAYDKEQAARRAQAKIQTD